MSLLRLSTTDKKWLRGKLAACKHCWLQSKYGMFVWEKIPDLNKSQKTLKKAKFSTVDLCSASNKTVQGKLYPWSNVNIELFTTAAIRAHTSVRVIWNHQLAIQEQKFTSWWLYGPHTSLTHLTSCAKSCGKFKGSVLSFLLFFSA